VRVWPVEHPRLGPCFALRLVYNEGFQAEFLARTRPRHRAWYPRTLTWYVRREYRVCLQRLFRRFYGFEWVYGEEKGGGPDGRATAG
jgi:hypothetical protein